MGWKVREKEVTMGECVGKRRKGLGLVACMSPPLPRLRHVNE
jgi:hypothetical protein